MAFSRVDDFYRSRGLQAPGLIDDDRRCLACGYQLRGLREGQRCPECGRPIIPLRGQGLAEAETALLKRLALGLLLAGAAWAAGMGVWVWTYYGLLSEFIPLLLAMLVVFANTAVFRGLRIWTTIQLPRNRFENWLPFWMGLLTVAGSILALLLVLCGTVFRNATTGSALIGLATLGSLAWFGLQTLACLLFQQIAVAGHDDRLGERFWHLAWGVGLCAAFVSPFFGVTQVIVGRSGGFAPVCCWSGYLFVISLLAAQIAFAHSLLRLRAMVRWCVKYRNQYDSKTSRMMEGIEEGRKVGDSEGSVFLRGVE